MVMTSRFDKPSRSHLDDVILLFFRRFQKQRRPRMKTMAKVNVDSDVIRIVVSTLYGGSGVVGVVGVWILLRSFSCWAPRASQ